MVFPEVLSALFLRLKKIPKKIILQFRTKIKEKAPKFNSPQPKGRESHGGLEKKSNSGPRAPKGVKNEENQKSKDRFVSPHFWWASFLRLKGPLGCVQEIREYPPACIEACNNAYILFSPRRSTWRSGCAGMVANMRRSFAENVRQNHLATAVRLLGLHCVMTASP